MQGFRKIRFPKPSVRHRRFVANSQILFSSPGQESRHKGVFGIVRAGGTEILISPQGLKGAKGEWNGLEGGRREKYGSSCFRA